MNDAYLKTVFCPRPFEYLDIHFTDGEIRLYSCCPTWLPKFTSASNFDQVGNLWNSAELQDIRASILDGSYKYCNKNLCPEIQSKTLHDYRFAYDPRHRKIIQSNSTKLSGGPRIINFSEDRTCNLSCPSCRNSIITMGAKDTEEIKKFHDKILPNLLKGCEFIHICSAGDPFASKVYRDLLFCLDGKQYPNLNININTNGVLFDSNMWERMHKIHNNIHTVFISLDAATNSTYRQVRRGGSFTKVLENIAFLADQRRKGNFKSLQLDFVVQDSNFQEMPAFVELGKKLNVDKVYFQRISNWGTYNTEEYKAKDIVDYSHPRHAEFLAICKSDILASAIIKSGNLTSYFPQNWQTKVKNTLKRFTLLRYIRIFIIKIFQFILHK